MRFPLVCVAEGKLDVNQSSIGFVPHPLRAPGWTVVGQRLDLGFHIPASDVLNVEATDVKSPVGRFFDIPFTRSAHHTAASARQLPAVRRRPYLNASDSRSKSSSEGCCKAWLVRRRPDHETRAPPSATMTSNRSRAVAAAAVSATLLAACSDRTGSAGRTTDTAGLTTVISEAPKWKDGEGMVDFEGAPALDRL